MSFGGETFGLYQKGCNRVWIGRQLARHKADLDKRPYAVFQQPIVNLVDVGEVVNRVAMLVFVIDPHFIVQDRVKPHIAKAGLACTPPNRCDSSRAEKESRAPNRTSAPRNAETDVAQQSRQSSPPAPAPARPKLPPQWPLQVKQSNCESSSSFSFFFDLGFRELSVYNSTWGL